MMPCLSRKIKMSEEVVDMIRKLMVREDKKREGKLAIEESMPWPQDSHMRIVGGEPHTM